MKNLIKNISQKKVIFFISYFIFIFIIFIFHDKFTWNSNAQLYIFLEVSSLFLALLVGILTLMRFYAKKNNIFLFMGMGFIGASIIDSYHIIIVSDFFTNLFPPLSLSFSYWNWVSSRLFLSCILLLSLLGWLTSRNSNEKKIIFEEIHITTLVISLLILNISFFSLLPVENSIVINYPFIEMIPELFFLLSLIGYLKKKDWKSDYFEYWFIFFLITNVIVEIFFMPASTEMFDFMFTFSHVLKSISYFFIFIGFLASTYDLFKEVETTKSLLTSQNLSQKQTRLEMEEALKSSILNETELNIKISDLEKIKKALYNSLEDLSDENRKVEEAKAKDDAILSSIGEGMIVSDQKDKIILVNPQTEIMLGMKSQDLINKKWMEKIKIQDKKGDLIPEELNPIRFALIQKRQLIENSYSLIRSDGTTLPAAITTSPVFLSNKVIGSIMVFRDITKEREIDKMKTEFIALASHQLRTPLSAIKWFAEMLSNGDAGVLNNEQSEFIQNISQSTERMIQLVNALLNISRIESGRIIIDPKPTDIKLLINEVCDEVKVKMLLKKQKLNLEIQNDLPLINIDAKLIRQVYLNLLTNAIKYTPNEGEILINVCIKNNEVISQMKDNGYGIPQKELGKVFQKFFRAENIIKIETDGTGLGLYLVKAIVDSSQGKIWFESEEGKGTSFWFSLPLSGTLPRKGEVTLDT